MVVGGQTPLHAEKIPPKYAKKVKHKTSLAGSGVSDSVSCRFLLRRFHKFPELKKNINIPIYFKAQAYIITSLIFNELLTNAISYFKYFTEIIILWQASEFCGVPLCGDPIRPNMLNMRKSGSVARTMSKATADYHAAEGRRLSA